jgi:hypothetical protein
MQLKTEDYILATVAYADIFHYPLTLDDAYFWCVKKNPRKNFRTGKMRGVVRQNYFLFLKGRKSLLESYEKRLSASKRKWEIARSVGMHLRIIPSVLLAGVTGGVAVKNASPRDDIDLFFITAKGTLWITRLLVILVLELLGKRRRPGDKNVTDKICINMFMSEQAMCVSKNEQDLFSAHEVLQMEPLWSRRDTYRRFLQANHWTESYLPVAWSIKQTGRNQHPKISRWYTRVMRFFLRFLETPAKFLQLWYMRTRRTSEVISDGVLRFHPRDARAWIRSALGKRLAKYNIPLDNIFYDR